MKWELTRAFFAALLVCAMAVAFPLRADEVEERDTAAMQGTWAIESFTFDGNLMAPEQFKNWRRIVQNNHVTWKNGDETLLELEIKIYPAAQPKTLDSTFAAGDSKGQTLLAIYELKGDELRVCFANPGKPRPTEFTSTSGSGQSLYVAKRVKP
jgi:uncharacterized protein (TIGR03067 family)